MLPCDKLLEKQFANHPKDGEDSKKLLDNHTKLTPTQYIYSTEMISHETHSISRTIAFVLYIRRHNNQHKSIRGQHIITRSLLTTFTNRIRPVPLNHPPAEKSHVMKT